MPEQRTSLPARIWRRRFDLLILTIGLILAALVGLTIVGLVDPATLPAQLQPLRRLLISENFTAYLSIMELVLLLGALGLTAFHFRHARAARFIERFNSPEIIQMRGRIDDWLSVYEASSLRARIRDRGETVDEDEALQLGHLEARLLLELQRDPTLDKTLKAFANLFQEVGEAYENQTVSPSYTRRMFDFLAPHYWKILRFWIDDYRLQGSPTLYARFGRLARSIEENPRKLARMRKRHARANESERAGPDPSGFARERRAMLVQAQRPQRLLLFGYGSMLARRSRQHAATSDGEPLTATLHGYVRAWNTMQDVILEGDEQARPNLFLGLALARDGACNGVLVPVRPDELPRLDEREKSYVRIDVTPWIEIAGGEVIPNAQVFTYIGRPQFVFDPHEDVAPAGLCLADHYVDLVEEGLRGRPVEFIDAFRRSTWPPPPAVPIVKGAYRFPDPAQNRATGRDLPAADGGPSERRDPR